VRTLLERGIRVTLPRRLLQRTLRLPLAVERSLSLQGRALRVDARPAELVLTPAGLWYALEVSVREASAPPL
jgi:hypothetical protein